MRRMFVVLLVLSVPMFVPIGLTAQRRPPRMSITDGPLSADAVLKQSIEHLGIEKKNMDRDLQVLARIRAADRALTDPMQPSVAVEKAFEEISEAERLNADFYVQQGIIRVRQEMAAARRSPASADFGRLAALIREHALGPASRVVVRNAIRLQEETLGWIAVQEKIATHLKMLAEITGESLRASDQE
ncbi:MAG TPA: hypothetical protein VF432_29715 [Thermoanaerobaculia bacterium]